MVCMHVSQKQLVGHLLKNSLERVQSAVKVLRKDSANITELDILCVHGMINKDQRIRLAKMSSMVKQMQTLHDDFEDQLDEYLESLETA